MPMDDRFTKSAKEALVFAHEYALQLGHAYVGSEHILLGISRDAKGVAQSILRDYGLETQLLYDLIEQTIGSGEVSLPAQGLTPRAKRVIELAQASAVQLGHRYVGTEHLLMGILREHESMAARLLLSMGLDPNRMYTDIIEAFSDMELTNPGATGGSVRKNSLQESKTLAQFGRDLTELAARGELDPVVSRTEETDRVIQILSRRLKNNPVLIGEPGVGKTAIAEGLAQRIIAGKVPEDLKNKQVVTLDLSGMLAGTKYRGDFEERIRAAMEEVKTAGNIILFIDELHTIIGAGAAEGAIDAANIVKPALGRGELQIIGATTLDEYRKHIEKDAALARRFQPVLVEEPSEAESLRILQGLRDKYEAHHKLSITDEAMQAAVTLSARYITDRFLPDKAIDLIDEAASRVRVMSRTAPKDQKDLQDKIDALVLEKDAAIGNQNYEQAALLRDEERALKKQLEQCKEEANKVEANKQVTAEDVACVVSAWTKIPLASLSEDESARLLRLEAVLEERVIGQGEARGAVARAIRRGRVGLKDPKRPTGSFLFLGPTGVGKTELCRALAQAVFGDEEAMIRIDMSEFMEKHTVSKLIGSPPGYVGYDEGGSLTEKVRRRPYSVVLFDEIEKGHADVWSLLLQIMEDGHLTDGQGRKVDFKNTIIVMTSNVGAKHISEKRQQLGFSADTDHASGVKSQEEIHKLVIEELKRVFRPEFLNRVDETIVFHQLSKEDMVEITKLMLAALQERLEALGIKLVLEEDAVLALAEQGFDPAYGARPLRRFISRVVEDPAAELLLKGEVTPGDQLAVRLKDGEIVLEAQSLLPA